MRISDWSSGVCSSDLSDLSDEVDVRDAVAAEGRRGCGNGLCERGGCGEQGGGGGQKGQRAKNGGLAHLSLLFGSESAPAPGGRSDERRVGKERVSPCRSRGSPYATKKHTL